MNNFTIATNVDNHLEAFYTLNGVVMHAQQKSPLERVSFTAGTELLSSKNVKEMNGKGLDNATHIETYSDEFGYIHVVACTSDSKYFTCFQTHEGWSGWHEIGETLDLV